MKLDGFPKMLFGLLDALTRGNASGKIWNVARIISIRLFDYNRVPHYPVSFKPACFKILFMVPAAKSSFRLPGTVTRPDFIWCLY